MDAPLKSLLVDEYVLLEVIERRKIELTEEGAGYVKDGTPEFQYASALSVGTETLTPKIRLSVSQRNLKTKIKSSSALFWLRLNLKATIKTWSTSSKSAS